jgi:chitinase
MFDLKLRRIPMLKKKIAFIYLLFYIVLLDAGSAAERPWVTGYLPSYHQSPDGNIHILLESDYQKLTHLSHHGPYVNPDGSFNYEPTCFSDLKSVKAVAQAHQQGVPILLCIVGWYDQYIEAINDSLSRTRLIKNVLKLVDLSGYDGVDVDLEPVMSAYIPAIVKGNPHYIQFVNQLYDSLSERTSPLLKRSLLLTAPMNGYAGPVFAQIYEKFDQINLMTYDLVSPDWGFPVWHDSPIYSAGYMISGKPAPSVQGEVQKCLDAGVPPEKIGIGVSCDAFRWKGGTGTPKGGATAPRQQWLQAPSWTRFAYKDMLTQYYRPEYYRWDAAAKMSYLSIDRDHSANDEFWSFNDEKSCQAKVEFVKENRLGGLIIWELGSGYVASQSIGKRLPQLNAIDAAIFQSSAIDEKKVRAAFHFLLPQNYPNPFNASTAIEYFIVRDSYVHLTVYNILGQLIETLVAEYQAAGNYQVVWPGKNQLDSQLPTGVYFCRFVANGNTGIRKMIMVQ